MKNGNKKINVRGNEFKILDFFKQNKYQNNRKLKAINHGFNYKICKKERKGQYFVSIIPAILSVCKSDFLCLKIIETLQN